MHGLSLLFLAWSLAAYAAILPISTPPTVGEIAKLLKVPISSKLLPVNALTHQLRTRVTTSNAPSTRNTVLKVVTSVQCGQKQTFNDVLVDTGSAILWFGGESPYVPGSNTVVINSDFSVGYGAGGVQGTAFRDTVIIGEATGVGQIIGAANKTTGFNLVRPIDGILGLGPSGSNSGDVTGFDSTPTFVETLVAQNQISKPMFGIFVNPLGTDGTPEGTGEITFGGIDESKIQGEVTWVAQNAPVNFHWEFNISSFSFGTVNLTEPTFARTDTGVLSIGIPFDSYLAMNEAYNGSIHFDRSALSGFLNFNSNDVPSLPNLSITLGSETFSIPPSKYIVPRQLYPMLNVTDVPGLEKTWIASAGPGSFGLGQKWLENVYTAYDMENHRVGFARSSA
ncbi:acid protease [Phlegmacium glaucopus]|nr:acid protease [Phlegmacium glaucopus]